MCMHVRAWLCVLVLEYTNATNDPNSDINTYIDTNTRANTDIDSNTDIMLTCTQTLN